MALIRSFRRQHMDRNSAHQAIDATYTPFERDGRVFIQIDTYGRVTRPDVGSKSQSFQLDGEGAIELFKILRREFQLQ